MIHKLLITVVLLGSLGVLAQSQETEKASSTHPCRPCDLPEGLLIPAQGNSGKYGFANKHGVFVIAPQFGFVWNFSEGLAAVRVGDIRTGKYGYVDEKGRMIIPAKFDSHQGFSEGLAAVQVDATHVDDQGVAEGGKWGYVDKTGKFLVRSRLRSADNFSEGLAAVEEWNAEINTDAFGTWAKEGFINRRGEYVIKPEFESVNRFREGLAAVRQNGKWGFIDKTGRLVIPAIYDFASSFGDQRDGLAGVVLGKESYFVNKEGKLINR